MARGTFKQKRGGGRNFSKNLVLDEDGTAVSVDRPRGRRNQVDDDNNDESEEEESSEEEEEEEEESEEEGEAGTSQVTQPELTRVQRKELKKKKKEQAVQKAKGDQDEGDEDNEEDPILANPNIAVGKKMNISDLNAPRQLTRRERDEQAAKEAKERYWKMHEQGKTEQAKTDLARLAKIRAEREAAQAKRKAEAEAKAKEIDVRRQEQLAKEARKRKV